MKNIVCEKELTYDVLKDFIFQLEKRYPDLRVATCGKSVLRKELFSLCIGKGTKKVIFVGGTHGLEWITSLVLLRFCEELLKAKECNGKIAGFDIEEILNDISLVVIPAFNPDGIDLAIKGVSACEENKEKIYDICKFDFIDWNANANGVDLNHNFNADWYKLRDYEEKNGITKPSPRRFGGFYPESEPETKSIVDFLRKVPFDRLFSFHSQGEEIFYEYSANTPEKSLHIAKALSGVSGYTLVKNEGHYSSGGLKDWFIEEFKKPAFTIEVGMGKNPLPLTEFEEIYKKAELLSVLGLML